MSDDFENGMLFNIPEVEWTCYLCGKERKTQGVECRIYFPGLPDLDFCYGCIHDMFTHLKKEMRG